MFEKSDLMFMYCISPVHMGAGQALGVIDNPIQRERHSQHPNMAGSGIKGALRHHAQTAWDDKASIKALFGPESSAEYAGSISFGDGQLLAFPVRSLKQGFVYAVSPLTLARLKRLATLSGLNVDWRVPSVDVNQALIVNTHVLNDQRLILETFEYSAKASDDLKKIAAWIAQQALPQSETHAYFREKLSNDLVLLPDDSLSHFCEHATVVEAHVRIDDETGTAAKGGLFYSENLPPETLMIAPVFASKERKKSEGCLSAREVMKTVQQGFNAQSVQFGGNATTGRGQVILNFALAEAEHA